MEGRRPRLAIFRPREKLAESVRLAEARGYEVLAVPMVETREYDDPRFLEFLEMLEEDAVDAFSRNVVRAYHARVGLSPQIYACRAMAGAGVVT